MQKKGQKMIRRKLTDTEKASIGLSCINCGNADDLTYHHVIPLSIGGNDVNSNIVCLCDKCHTLLHGNYDENGYISHGKLVKLGQQRALANNKKMGAHIKTADDVTDDFKNEVMKFVKQQYPYNKPSIRDFSRKSGICNMKIHRDIHRLKTTSDFWNNELKDLKETKNGYYKLVL